MSVVLMSIYVVGKNIFSIVCFYHLIVLIAVYFKHITMYIAIFLFLLNLTSDCHLCHLISFNIVITFFSIAKLIKCMTIKKGNGFSYDKKFVHDFIKQLSKFWGIFFLIEVFLNNMEWILVYTCRNRLKRYNYKHW
jgi:hypothetical protein